MSKSRDECIHYLESFLSPDRKLRCDQVLANRTRYASIVLEDIHQPHNISAVIRSCECFGIQNLHVIDNLKNFKVNKDIAMGSSKWIDIHRHFNASDNTSTCLNELKAQGYKIAALSLAEPCISLDELPIDEKFALCIGAELNGLSDAALALADYHVKIPMVGFTQSFNLSVTAALCLYELTHKIRQSDFKWQLSLDESQDIRLEWYKKMVQHSEDILKGYLNS